MQPVSTADIVGAHMLRREQPGGGVLPVKEEAARAVSKIGDECHAGGVTGHDDDTRGVDAILCQSRQQAAAEIILADDPDKSGRASQASNRVDENRRIAAREWTGKG